MKFKSVVGNITKTNDLKRIAKARLVDVTRLDDDDIRKLLLKAAHNYSNVELIQAAISEAILHRSRDHRTITSILLGEVLLQAPEYSLPQKDTEEKVLEWEQQVIDESNEKEIGGGRKIHNFDFFKFVLEAAWEENNEISQDEKKLIERIRKKLKITEREYRLVEADLGKFPKLGNELHTRQDINIVRNYLQESGLLLTYRESDGSDHDVIPEEMVQGVKDAFGVSMRRYGYKQLIKYKSVKKKQYLEETLQKGGVVLARSLTVEELQELCIQHLTPEVVLGGVTPRDGLDSNALENWCKEIGQQSSGTKTERMSRIIEHYDMLFEKSTDQDDPRKPWFDFYEEFAGRNYHFLRAQHLIEKDQDIDKRFEKATDYLFEYYLRHNPLNLPGNEQPDGALSLGDEVLFWDNKSKETQVAVKEHFAQFERYFNKSEKRVSALVVISPSFTPESDADARAHEIQTGNSLSLITAKELKDIAISWSVSKRSQDAFPIKYLTAAGRFNTQFLKDLF